MQKSAEFCIISLHIMKQLINHIFLKKWIYGFVWSSAQHEIYFAGVLQICVCRLTFALFSLLSNDLDFLQSRLFWADNERKKWPLFLQTVTNQQISKERKKKRVLAVCPSMSLLLHMCFSISMSLLLYIFKVSNDCTLESPRNSCLKQAQDCESSIGKKGKQKEMNLYRFHHLNF